MIVVNCSAIPTPLLESELFGREKGAYTGAALENNWGRFELAHGSTLFLDEIGELPLEVQVKLPASHREPHHRATREPEADPDRRPHHRGHPSRPGGGRPRREVPGGSVLPPQRVSNRRPARCANVGTTFPPLVRTFVEELTRSMGKRVREIDPRSLDALASTPGPATSANSATPSNGP